MDDERLPKRLFYGDVATGSRRQGGQIRRYKDTLKSSLKLLQINPTNWEEIALDRPTWRRTVKTGAAIYEANRIAAAKSKREARKSQLRPGIKCNIERLPRLQDVYGNKPSADPLQCGHAILQLPCAVEAIEAVTTHRHLSILHSVRPVQNSIAHYLDPKAIIDRPPTASLGTARGQFTSPPPSSPMICYPPPLQSPTANFPHTPSSNRTLYMSAASDTPSSCASMGGRRNMGSSSRTHGAKREALNWKQRCTTDPWTGILPQATPGNGDRLVTSACNQRHTVLFAPHSRISHETIMQSS
nr:unnamed protein product [Spirometra erinaceieuropaei]